MTDNHDRERGFASAAEHLANIEALTAECEAAIARDGAGATVKYELPAFHWLAIFDEIKNRRRENYSKLIADQHISELNAAISRLHDEIVYLVAYGPRASVSDAFAARGLLANEELRKGTKQ